MRCHTHIGLLWNLCFRYSSAGSCATENMVVHSCASYINHKMVLPFINKSKLLIMCEPMLIDTLTVCENEVPKKVVMIFGWLMK